jgi:hypothetical protein
MRPIHSLALACLGALGSSQGGQADLSLVVSISPTPTLTSFLTSTVTLISSSRAAEPSVDGRCYWAESTRRWTCKRKGFACGGDYVCIDHRTELQKQVDKQEAADGTNGRCLYTFLSDTFGCTRKGFECVDEVLCVDKRTERERMDDEEEEEERERTRRKKYVKDAAIGGTLGGILGLFMLCCCCACVEQRKERKNSAKKVKRERKQGEADAIELRRIKVRDQRRHARQQRKVEDGLVKAIQESEAGSQAQLGLSVQLEKTRAARAGGVAGTQATRTTAAGAGHEGHVDANRSGLSHVYEHIPAEANGTGDIDRQGLSDYSS